MKLQKHYTQKGKKYPKYELVLPKKAIKEAGFKEGDELTAEAKKGEIKLRNAYLNHVKNLNQIDFPDFQKLQHGRREDQAHQTIFLE